MYFRWTRIGAAQDATGTFHVIEFHNIGRAPAVIIEFLVADARAVLSEAFRAPTVVEPGGSFRLMISAEKLDRGWFRLMWQTVSDERKVHVFWDGLAPLGSRAEERRDELAARSNRFIFIRWLLSYRGEYVGPGGAPRATFRRGTRFKKRLDRILGPVPGVEEWWPGMPTPSAVEDYPFVPYVAGK